MPNFVRPNFTDVSVGDAQYFEIIKDYNHRQYAEILIADNSLTVYSFGTEYPINRLVVGENTTDAWVTFGAYHNDTFYRAKCYAGKARRVGYRHLARLDPASRESHQHGWFAPLTLRRFCVNAIGWMTDLNASGLWTGSISDAQAFLHQEIASHAIDWHNKTNAQESAYQFLATQPEILGLGDMQKLWQNDRDRLIIAPPKGWRGRVHGE